jgi:hypothetical protein
MNFFKRLANLFTGGGRTGSDERMLSIYLLSRRCNEPLIGQIDRLNELSQSEEDADGAYYARKVFRTSGRQRCFDQVEVELWFDTNKRVIRHEVTGGRWLEAAEYEQELARFNAPPDESTQVDR